jgi:hypothetical protein
MTTYDQVWEHQRIAHDLAIENNNFNILNK